MSFEVLLAQGVAYLACLVLVLCCACWVRVRASPECQSSKYDWALVVRVYPSAEKLSAVQLKYSLRSILERLAKAGLETRPSRRRLREGTSFSAHAKQVTVHVRAPPPRLAREMVRVGTLVEFDEGRLRLRAEQGKAEGAGKWAWRPLEIPDDKKRCRYKPYRHCHATFNEHADLAPLWKRASDAGGDAGDGAGGDVAPGDDATRILRDIDRIRLLQSIIEAPLHHGGAELALTALVADSVLVKSYAMHDAGELASLVKAWQSPLRRAPVSAVRGYFGEAVALRVAFSSHDVRTLAPFAVFGFFIWCASFSKFGSAQRVLAAFTVAWTLQAHLDWVRTETALALEWGTRGSAHTEKERAEYRSRSKGEVISNPVTGALDYLYVRGAAKFDVHLQVGLIVLGCLGLTIVGVAIQVLVAVAARKKSRPLAMLLLAVFDAVRVAACRPAWASAAGLGARLRNEKTESQYASTENLLFLAFEASSAYAAPIAVVFLRNAVLGCEDGANCRDDVGFTVAVMFCLRSSFNVFFTNPATSLAMELVDVGYVALFTAASPLLPLAALGAALHRARRGAADLCGLSERPVPLAVERLGAVDNASNALTVLTCLANALFCASSAAYLSNVEATTLFLVVEHAFLAMRCLVSLLGDEHPDVAVQAARHAFIRSKVVSNVRDEDDDPRLAGLARKAAAPVAPDYCVFANDDDWKPVPASD